MNIIWYNSDQNEYKCGDVEEFNNDLIASKNRESYSVLMKFNNGSKSMAHKVLKQLNLINSTTKVPFIL